MNKFLSICLVCVCLVQNVFSAASIEINDQENSSPIRRSSSLRYGFSFGRNPERIIREGSSKRSRDSESISPSDRRTPLKRNESIPRPAGTSFEFSDAHKNTLRQIGIPELQISKIEFLQTALFRSPHGDQFDPRSYLTEEELEAICKKIGSEEVRLLVFTLKSLYDKKIPLAGKSPNTIYTPAARLSADCRKAAKETSVKLATCEGIHVKHVTGYTFVEEETTETTEERATRHKLKEELFKTLEARRGITETDRTFALSKKEQIWSNYFEFMRLRIDSIDQRNVQKITGHEIEDTFKELVGKAYSFINVGDSIVYYHPEEIDLKRLALNEKSNELLLSEGLSPIGADGKSMNLHHLTRRQPGIFVLLTETFHQRHTTLLHLRSEKHMRQPQPVDRAVFASWKKFAFTAIKEALVPTEEVEFDPSARLFSETAPQPQDAAPK